MNNESDIRICVVGAGVIGLTTATMMQEALPKAKITLFADKFLADTTSSGAAGIFFPGAHFRGPSYEIALKWLRDSYEFYDKILKNNPEATTEMGLLRQRVVTLTDKPSSGTGIDPYIQKIISDYRSLSQGEIREVTEGLSFEYGFSCNTILTECKKYQPYLTKRFTERGGKIVNKRLQSLEELADDFDLILNCSGLGAAKLCGDTWMTPIRGQVFKVKAPWIKCALFVESDTYIIPGTDGLVTIGGTRQFGSADENVDRHDAASIWDKCTNVLPSLKKAKIMQEWVGLRPYRPKVRIESETFNFKSGKSVQVIHNYGHGSYGVMSAPGTSMHAVNLALQHLQRRGHSKL